VESPVDAAAGRAGALAAMTALVMLTGCLSGHTQPEGDLRPSDTQAHSVINQNRELSLCFQLYDPGALDPF
jgi:hypothetical protein